MCVFQHPILLTHLKIVQVSGQLVEIFRHTVLSVVLEVVGQTIIKEQGALRRKRESQKHSRGSETGVWLDLKFKILFVCDGCNLEESVNGELHIAHTGHIFVGALEAWRVLVNPSVVDLCGKGQERSLLIIDQPAPFSIVC